MILVPNKDQRIWSAEFIAVDIVKELTNHGSCVIDLNSEGPDATELGLYMLLDHICRDQKFDKKSITIKTFNPLEKHSEYNVITNCPAQFVHKLQHFSRSNNYTSKNVDNIKHFGIFVGRSNWQRLWLSAELFDKYQSQTLQTFLYKHHSDFHTANLGLEELVRQLGSESNLASVAKLLQACPVELEPVQNFPILTPDNLNIAKRYSEFLIEIVCETYSAGTSFFPTEKTWRAIACKTPFMVQGPVHYLKNLKTLGFKTFDQYWDESYDIDGQILGTKRILENIQRLSEFSTVQLEQMYQSMMPVLDHNYHTLMQLREKDFDLLK